MVKMNTEMNHTNLAKSDYIVLFDIYFYYTYSD